jgi:REP element-mobilizing transposase RayT
MSQPPRLDQIFERNREITYFLTWCVKDKEKVLGNGDYYNALKIAINQADRWHVECGVIMPDHVHLLVSPYRKDESVGKLAGFLKKRSKFIVKGKWDWQPSSFDRLLRSNESAEQKWKYIRENPVRGGLVSHWQKWEYRFGCGG